MEALILKFLIVSMAWSFDSYEEKFNEYTISWELKDQIYLTSLQNEQGIVKTWEGSYVSDRFLKAKQVGKYLYLVWRKGVHGERIEVFDTESKEFVWEFNSSWPIQVSAKKDKLSIEVFLESGDERRFKSEFKYLDLN